MYCRLAITIPQSNALSIEIAAVEPAEYDDILQLNEASVPHVNSIDATQFAWFCEYGAFVRSARIDGRLAGFIVGLRPGIAYASDNYRWFCEHYDDFAYVDRIAVADWARRRGVAERLYTEFAASQSDAPIMTCEVNLRPPNEGSMNFHKRLGFRQVGSQETDAGAKEVALLEKTL